MKFTKEEISLCKQVANRYEKKIEHGGWFIWEADQENKAYLWKHDYDPQKSKEADQMIRLWTIFDCLEFLDKTKDITLRICSHPDFNQTTVEFDDIEYYGKTPLEACLKAVLAVLEDIK